MVFIDRVNGLSSNKGGPSNFFIQLGKVPSSVCCQNQCASIKFLKALSWMRFQTYLEEDVLIPPLFGDNSCDNSFHTFP